MEIAKWTPFSRLAVIVEESKRSSPLVAGAFAGFGLRVDDQDVPIDLAFMPKSASEPGLEVADFIIHTAGGQARQKLGRQILRKDFQAIFHSMGPKLTSLLDIDAVSANVDRAENAGEP